jgi:PAS domain-containing protein
MKLDSLNIQHEALFEAVLNTVSDAITVIDEDLKIIFQNEAVYKTYGSRIGELCFEAYRGRHEPCENCIILDVIKDSKPRKGSEIFNFQTAIFFGWRYFQDPLRTSREKP